MFERRLVAEDSRIPGRQRHRRRRDQARRSNEDQKSTRLLMP